MTLQHPLSATTLTPISLRMLSTLSTSRAEEHVPQLINKSRVALSARFALISENICDKLSQDRLWEVEKIVQRRIARGRGLRARYTKPYLIPWTPSWLSAEELRYARKSLGRLSRLRKIDGQRRETRLESHGPPHGCRPFEHASTSDSE